jgi:hypothetical protein
MFTEHNICHKAAHSKFRQRSIFYTLYSTVTILNLLLLLFILLLLLLYY